MAQDKKYKRLKALAPYYRDSLTQEFMFSNVGQLPMNLLQWAVNGAHTNAIRLTELLGRTPPSGLTAEKDLALKLMLHTILQANLLTGVDEAIPAVEENVREGLKRVLAIDAQPVYLVNSVLLLYRMGAVEEVMELSRRHAGIFKEAGQLRAVMGFIGAMTGDYAAGIEWLEPLLREPQKAHSLIITLSDMTCRFMLGQTPSVPLDFECLDKDIAALDRQIALLPPMRMLKPLTKSAAPIIFAVCNDAYFYKHALHLAYSLHATNAKKPALHLHLYSPNPSTLAEIERLRGRVPGLEIGVSTEVSVPRAGPQTMAYAPPRFIRMYEAMRYYNRPLCLMDAEALMRHSWDTFSGMLNANTELALGCPAGAPFWERITPAFLYARPGELSQKYLAKTAQFITANLAREDMFSLIEPLALAVCDERFAKDSPAALHLDSERLVDATHGPEALSWIPHKKKPAHYDRHCKRLRERYGQLAGATPQEIFAHISQAHAPVFFLQIGAMDGVSYDPIHTFVKTFGWQGILVEPLPDMMAKLKANYAGTPGLAFENIAITEKAETRMLYRIPPEAAAKGNLPDWAFGMSSFLREKLFQFNEHIIEQPVTCLPLDALLARHKPEKIDVLQIDTEGLDYTILRQFDFKRYQPLVVNFESVHLKPEEKRAAMELLMQHGYIFYENELDIFAARREVLFAA